MLTIDGPASSVTSRPTGRVVIRTYFSCGVIVPLSAFLFICPTLRCKNTNKLALRKKFAKKGRFAYF